MLAQPNRNVASACLLHRAGEFLSDAIRIWSDELEIESDAELDLMVGRITATHGGLKSYLHSIRALQADEPWSGALLSGLRGITKSLESLVIEPWQRASRSGGGVALARKWKKKGGNPLVPVQEGLGRWKKTLIKSWLEVAHDTCRACLPPAIPPANVRFFIASSAEGADVAAAIRDEITTLRPKWELILWNDPHVFPPGESTLETLENVISGCHFGMYLLTPDDKLVFRGNKTASARGNVLIEFGMGIGFHGRRRSFILHSHKVHIPSDLKGITALPFKQPDAKRRTSASSKTAKPKLVKSPVPSKPECVRVAKAITAAVDRERVKTRKEWE